ncbi:hypothetical protein C8J36_105184 [Rhizobium sp. PP-F2F-G48]|uniref:spike base protein, RCAP_Rcc01079 family n=1 Tax=Rhizobium sp. PP-F2F-G48 TaxID=2135651 RepID=UPI00104A74A8|nr:hypothetical protein [Rhizobium sp. PP-F2F-G48]TCM54327.1 hypothetical protein C8J36_105184 [Rhizobium sp. PP-F2F-G48]
MTDRYAHTADSLSSPATHAFAITPADALDLPETTRAIFVGSGGAIALRMQSGALVTLAGVPQGTLLPLRADRILASGTTASGLVGLV